MRAAISSVLSRVDPPRAVRARHESGLERHQLANVPPKIFEAVVGFRREKFKRQAEPAVCVMTREFHGYPLGILAGR
jgi:hypothetical protein